MIKIAPNGIIEVTRGDTFTLPLSLNVGTPLSPEYFSVENGDILRLRIYQANSKWEDYILSKTGTLDNVSEDKQTITFRFDSDDTLHINSGLYFYELKIFYTRDDYDYIETIIPRRKIYILN